MIENYAKILPFYDSVSKQFHRREYRLDDHYTSNRALFLYTVLLNGYDASPIGLYIHLARTYYVLLTTPQILKE